MPMAFEIFGAAVIEVKEPGGSYEQLGYTPNDQLPDFQQGSRKHEVTSTLRGEEAAEVVHLGERGVLSLAITEIDLAVWNKLKRIPGKGDTGGGTGPGAAGIVGKLMFEEEYYISVRITPIISGKQAYEFHRCWAKDDNAFAVSEMGNREAIFRAQLQVTRDPDTNNLYTVTTVP